MRVVILTIPEDMKCLWREYWGAFGWVQGGKAGCLQDSHHIQFQSDTTWLTWTNPRDAPSGAHWSTLRSQESSCLPPVTSEDHGSMEQKHRPEICRATWRKARTKMKLSGYLCTPSPAFSRLVGQGASLSPPHHGSASMALEYHDPL